MNDQSTIQDTTTKLEPLGNVPLSKLPGRFEDCFERAKTPDLEYFKVTIKTLGHWLLTAGAAFWLLIMVVQAFAASTNYNQLDKSQLPYNLMWGLPALIAFLITSYLTYRKEKYVYGVESGEMRIGMVIHPEALLVRLSENSCFLIPRSWLKAVTVQSYTHGKGGRATKMVFTDIDGKDHQNIISINSFGLFDYFDHQEKLAAALRSWNPELTVRG
jgi:hypothetical protein